MPGVWCPRCETNVRFLEQDGSSCPNCGLTLVTPVTYDPEADAAARTKAEATRATLQRKDATARRRILAEKKKARKTKAVTVPPDDQEPPPDPDGEAAA